MKVFLIVVIVMVVLLLGALGFVVLDKRINGSESQGVDVSADSSRADKGKDEAKAVDSYPLDDVVSEINPLLEGRVCGSKPAELKEEDFVVVDDTEPFVYEEGVSRIDKNLSYAYVQYDCGSHTGMALLIQDKEGWRLISSDSRSYPLCSSVRDRGFPASVIDKCFESINSREPIAL